MSDRELLEMASKAAGYHSAWLTHDLRTPSLRVRFTGPSDDPDAKFDCMDWNPLEDDGDALRLAVKLRISLLCAGNNTACDIPETDEYVWEDAIDPAAARRAIVRAAAEIGKAMQEKH